MTGFTVYSDASGAPADSPILLVAGFVSSEEKWRKFEGEWVALLDRYGIKPPFHMKEFAPGIKQYAAWKNDRGKREAFMLDAISILKRRTNKSFSAGMILKDLAEVNLMYEMPSSHMYPYPMCAGVLVKQVSDWIHRRNRDPRHRLDRITFVFEDGDKDKGIFINWMRKLSGNRVTPIFQNKEDAMPLQAADFVAWQHARAIKASLGAGRWGDVLDLFPTLAKQLPNDGSWSIIDKDAMIATCKRRGWRRRE